MSGPVAAPVGVVLAAGRGRRYGGPKQVATLDGRPLVAHAVSSLVAADLDVVVVVAPGPEGATVAEAAVAAADGATEVVVATNPDPDRGMGSSLATAAAAVGPRSLLVVLADQPRVPVADVRDVAAALDRGAAAVMTAYPDGGRGHPVGFGASLHERVLALRAEGAGRDLLLAVGPDLVHVDHDRPRDVDTPDDLAGLGRPGS